MPVRVGINGFGRIGRITFRAMERKYGNDLQVVAINDLVDAQTNAHLLKHDTNYGAFPGKRFHLCGSHGHQKVLKSVTFPNILNDFVH